MEILSKVGDKIVAVKQGQYLGVSFHPELTDDYRITKYFIEHRLNINHFVIFDFQITLSNLTIYFERSFINCRLFYSTYAITIDCSNYLSKF